MDGNDSIQPRGWLAAFLARLLRSQADRLDPPDLRLTVAQGVPGVGIGLGERTAWLDLSQALDFGKAVQVAAIGQTPAGDVYRRLVEMGAV